LERKAKMICVPDSSSLIILSKLERIALFSGLYNQALITPEVWEEVIGRGKSAGAPDVIYLEHFVEKPTFQRIKLTSVEKELTLRLKEKGNGAGESEVLAVALKRKAIAILDDKNARVSALGMGIQQTGTIGILYESYLLKIIDYVTLLEILGQFSRVAWISPDLLANIIKRAGEEKI
jgi:predicted nucleic acid-binding protein